MTINDPAVVAEVTAAFLDYERALNDNDVPALTASPRTSTGTRPSARSDALGRAWTSGAPSPTP
jgi:1-carboxybiuret hydrolase subunit AtzH-like protein